MRLQGLAADGADQPASRSRIRSLHPRSAKVRRERCCDGARVSEVRGLTEGTGQPAGSHASGGKRNRFRSLRILGILGLKKAGIRRRVA